tara:strand:- start:1224 stop:2132 length:909 start_codon:yes stop_codon:yes gene_type:complete
MIIESEQLTKRFGQHTVLKQLNLQVPEGAAYALLGSNGAGKSTLMRTLVNILQPDSGHATVLGKNTRNLAPEDFNQIGFVSESQVLPERLRISDYFDYLRALYPQWDRALERRLRANFDLPPERMLSKLSHGMRMKTVLVAGLAFRPKLLILDEPLSGMDTLTRDEVIDGLLEQAQETTIVISSHELAEIEHFTSHIAFMDKGHLVLQEPIESLQAHFRQVHVTLSAIKTLPSPRPSHWLSPQIEGHSLQFIESEYQDHQTLYQQLSKHFGAIQVEEFPMGLREISNVLIRNLRLNEYGVAP